MATRGCYYVQANSALDLAARMASSLKGQPASVAVPGALDRRLPSSGGSCAQVRRDLPRLFIMVSPAAG